MFPLLLVPTTIGPVCADYPRPPAALPQGIGPAQHPERLMNERHHTFNRCQLNRADPVPRPVGIASSGRDISSPCLYDVLSGDRRRDSEANCVWTSVLCTI
ncbi:hypothetical protein DPEC_G00081900 [Dallia pectoralis]|uniref:Uncharacterized protein n=1 Tax=Dallia pectoralis TaxID=75939 RepID=A0ACC2GYE3_DALPE|nr:hypothetical protein DPEC_G00081900 [Dallia pectoralis]